MTNRVTATHLVLNYGAAIFHVEMSREKLIELMSAADYSAGMDFPLLIKKDPFGSGPYHRANVWLGSMILLNAMVEREHEVEVTDEPLGGTGDDVIQLPDGSGGLEVRL